MAETTMTISDLNSLDQWRLAVRRAVIPSVLPSVEFSFSFLSPGGNRQLTLEAARLRNACGCATGALFMTAAGLAVALSLLRRGSGLAGISITGWLQYLAIVLVAAALGKLVGLLWARHRIVRLAEAVGGIARRDAGMAAAG